MYNFKKNPNGFTTERIEKEVLNQLGKPMKQITVTIREKMAPQDPEPD